MAKENTNRARTEQETKCREAQKFFINAAYYFGTIPFYMDSDFIVHSTRSKLHQARNVVTLFLVICMDLVIVATLVKDFIEGNFQMGDPDDTGRLINATGIGISGLLHLNTYWKRKETVALVNNFNNYVTKFKETSQCKNTDKKYGLVLKLCFLGCICVPFLALLVYLFMCKRHVLASVLPICDAEFDEFGQFSKWRHGPLQEIPLFGLLMWTCVHYTILSEYPIIVLMFLILFESKGMLSALTTVEKGTYLHEHDNWARHYRSFNLLVKELNGVIEEMSMPIAAGGLPLCIVLLNFILIRIDMNVFTTIYIFSLNVFASLLFILIFNRGTNILRLSTQVLEFRKSIPQSQTKFCRADLIGLKPATMGIGSVIGLNEESRLLAFTAVQDYTLNLLLA